MKFAEWFEKKLYVYSFPILNNRFFNASEWNVVINVSDEYHHDVVKKIKEEHPYTETHWFPMNECKKDVGLNSVYAAMVILYEAEINNKSVYLHCHAGVNRSPAIAAAYYFMRTGTHLKASENGFMNRLLAMCGRGYLPPKSETEKFLQEVAIFLQTQKMQGGYLDKIKIDSINNF